MMGPEHAEVYRSNAPELIRFAAVLVGPSEADDLLSAAVIRVFTASNWHAVENHRAYRYRTLINEASKHRRSAQCRLARELRATRSDRATDRSPSIPVGPPSGVSW